MDTTSETPILVEHFEDGLTKITFNRPNQRNAMNRAARVGIIKALDECRETAKVILITGNGPAFCAGVDIKEGQVSSGDAELDRRSNWAEVQEELRGHPAIIIAAVNGFALGGGLTLVNVADLAIAADEATFGMPEIGFNMYAAMAGPSTQLRTSHKRAAWLLLTGEKISGQQAADWGLINRSVPAAELHDESMALARRLAKVDIECLRACKRMLWKVPSEVSEWSAAIALGEATVPPLMARSKELARIREGTASPGQTS